MKSLFNMTDPVVRLWQGLPVTTAHHELFSIPIAVSLSFFSYLKMSHLLVKY